MAFRGWWGEAMQARTYSRGVIARWLAGPAIWAAHFVTVYGSEWLICTRGEAATHQMVIGAATAVGVVALLAVIALNAREPSGSGQRHDSASAFMARVGLALALLSLVGLLWTAVPALFLSPCTVLR